jgi:indolepyruvate ferredoxin oxidoreductase alpha subunit
LVVIEELDPFLETEIKAAGIPCEGKSLFSLLGEYTATEIQAVLTGTLPSAAVSCDVMPAAPARPPVMCAGCPHKGLFLALSRLKAVVMGDIGCYTLGALAPMNAMDACICMGASVGMAHGADKAGSPDLACTRSGSFMYRDRGSQHPCGRSGGHVCLTDRSERGDGKA